MPAYDIKSPEGNFVVVYFWGYDPFEWRDLPPCPECGVSCCRLGPDSGKCAGAYEGICHKVWTVTYGTTPWDD